MKRMLVLLVLVGITGCGKQESAPPPPSPPGMKLPPAPKLAPKVQAASEKYKALAYGTKQPDVVRTLGAPQSTNSDGGLVWLTTEGQQTAKLTLKFKADGTMTERNFAVLTGEQPK